MSKGNMSKTKGTYYSCKLSAVIYYKGEEIIPCPITPHGYNNVDGLHFCEPLKRSSVNRCRRLKHMLDDLPCVGTRVNYIKSRLNKGVLFMRTMAKNPRF